MIGTLIIAGTCFEAWTFYKVTKGAKNNSSGKFHYSFKYQENCRNIIWSWQLCWLFSLWKNITFKICIKELIFKLLPFLFLFPEKFLLGFSAYKNTLLLFSTSTKGQERSEILHCLNGIRFISITWVILGHVFGNFGNFPANNYVPYLLKVIWKYY